MRPIIYLHGFASSGNSFKGNFLREEFAGNAITPDLESIPNKDIKQIEKLIKKLNNPVIIGSSLGGFYAEYISKKYNLDALLINPLSKVIDIEFMIGTHKYFNSGIEFDFTQQDLLDLISYSNQLVDIKLGNEKRIILSAKDDDIIPYTKSIDHFKALNETVYLFNYGGHSFNLKDEILSHLYRLL